MRIGRIALVAALVGCGAVGNNAGNGNGGNGTGSGGDAGGNGTGGGSGGGGGGSADLAPAPQLDLYQSGTRIKMKVLTTPDGAKSFQGWHDTQLDIDCQFLAATDGQTRCLPLGTAYAQTFFAAGGSCAPTYRIYAVSGVYSGAVYVGTPASCNADNGNTASYTFFSLGGEVPPSTFVAGSITVQ
jgi:hypothetical protein